MALLQPFLGSPLSPGQIGQFQTYLDLLLKWNAKISLTAIRESQEIVQRHFGESLFAGEQAGVVHALNLIDIGSGAGFPGLPMAILAPHVEVTLVESQQKKVTFLREVIRTLGLKNVSVDASRAEESKFRAEIVTMRAVEKFEAVLPVAARIVSNSGRLALLVGSRQVEIVRKALLGFTWRDPIRVPESRERVVLIGSIAPARDRITES